MPESAQVYHVVALDVNGSVAWNSCLRRRTEGPWRRGSHLAKRGKGLETIASRHVNVGDELAVSPNRRKP
jgi:hypothetical protein